ncbi:unnamed protein product, partial [Prorocentrum cordatum]
PCWHKLATVSSTLWPSTWLAGATPGRPPRPTRSSPRIAAAPLRTARKGAAAFGARPRLGLAGTAVAESARGRNFRGRLGALRGRLRGEADRAEGRTAAAAEHESQLAAADRADEAGREPSGWELRSVLSPSSEGAAVEGRGRGRPGGGWLFAPRSFGKPAGEAGRGDPGRRPLERQAASLPLARKAEAPRGERASPL